MTDQVEGNKDKLYAKQLNPIADFAFDRAVAEVFDDMIDRSVPGYRDIVNMTGVLASRYYQEGTQIYDLGCSLGASTFSILKRFSGASCNIVCVDNSQAMLNQFEKRLHDSKSQTPVDLRCEDLKQTKINNASFVILNFILQFLEQETKEDLLKRIYEGLVEGGAVIVSEKVKFKDEAETAFLTDLHHTYKAMNGYSRLEISQKRTALENVLKSEHLGGHVRRLQKVGFRHTYLWFQCFNFASLIAIK